MTYTLENVDNNRIAITAYILGSMIQSCKSKSYIDFVNDMLQSSESYEQFLMYAAQTVQLMNSQEA